jgi:flagellar motor switch protein FliN/FliY
MTEESPMSEATDAAGELTLADLGGGTVPGAKDPGTTDLSLVLDVPVDLVVEIGRTRMTIRETLGICRGTIISLDRLAGEPADLLVNGRLVARGEVVAIDEEFGLRVTEVIAPQPALQARYETGVALATVEPQ